MPVNFVEGNNGLTAVNVSGIIESGFHAKLATLVENGKYKILINLDGAKIQESDIDFLFIAGLALRCARHSGDLAITLVPYELASFFDKMCRFYNIKLFGTMRDAINYFETL
jgi:hypothetical protein